MSRLTTAALRLSLLAPLVFAVGCGPAGHAAPPERVITDRPQTLVSPLPGETVLFQHDFTAPAPDGWELLRALIAEGTLQGNPETRWTEAVLPLSKPLPLARERWAFYFAVSTDPAAGEDASGLHIKLRLTADPGRREQISVNAITRASRGWYLFYVDPGFQIPHTQEQRLVPPPGRFANAAAIERFRLEVGPGAPGKLSAHLTILDSATSGWIGFRDRATQAPAEPLAIDIATELEGHSDLLALNFMFPSPVAHVHAVVLARVPDDAPAFPPAPPAAPTR